MIPSTLTNLGLKAKHTTIVSQHQKVFRQFQGITHALATKLLRCQVAATMQKAHSYLPAFPAPENLCTKKVPRTFCLF